MGNVPDKLPWVPVRQSCTAHHCSLFSCVHLPGQIGDQVHAESPCRRELALAKPLRTMVDCCLLGLLFKPNATPRPARYHVALSSYHSTNGTAADAAQRTSKSIVSLTSAPSPTGSRAVPPSDSDELAQRRPATQVTGRQVTTPQTAATTWQGLASGIRKLRANCLAPRDRLARDLLITACLPSLDPTKHACKTPIFVRNTTPPTRLRCDHVLTSPSRLLGAMSVTTGHYSSVSLTLTLPEHLGSLGEVLQRRGRRIA